MLSLYRPHDAPACERCADRGVVPDPLSADEDGRPDAMPCPDCSYDAEDAHVCDVAVAAERRVRVALWLVHLYRAEGDAVQYEWPRRAGWADVCDDFAEAANRMQAHAYKLAGGVIDDADWEAAMSAWAQTPPSHTERATVRPAGDERAA